MYKCDICGREVFKKIRMYGHTLCSKHMHQLHKYGHALDTNPRTVNDLNDYTIMPDGVYFNLYNIHGDWIGFFVVDLCDIELVKYHKWRLSHNRIITDTGENVRELSHIILGIPKEQDSKVAVRYVSTNFYDNRKNNLEIVDNQDTDIIRTRAIGISYDKHRNTFNPEITIKDKRVHLGRYRLLDEAKYVRTIAERYLANEELPIAQNISLDRQEELKNYTVAKIQAYFGN